MPDDPVPESVVPDLVAPSLVAPSLVVEINGRPHATGAGTTLDTLLADLGLDTRKIAIERNEAVVSRSRYANTRLEPGDRLEIVHFIGGG